VRKYLPLAPSWPLLALAREWLKEEQKLVDLAESLLTKPPRIRRGSIVTVAEREDQFYVSSSDIRVGATVTVGGEQYHVTQVEHRYENEGDDE
jgi:hypothetical protein